LSIISMLSIVLDIVSANTILYKDYFNAFWIYFFGIMYFVVTGGISAIFCVYALVQSRTDSIIKNLIGKLSLLLIPYGLYLVMVLSTPFTHLMFYLGEDNTYYRGPFMFINVILVIMYLVFCFIRVTFFSENISFRKRLPFYCFIFLMLFAIILQWIFKDYLLYGFSEAIGTLVLYLSNHNYNDLIDIRTEVYNRRTAIEKLKDIRNAGEVCCLIGIGVFDQQFKDQNVGDEDLSMYTDSFAVSFTRFLSYKFDIQNVFCIETNVYMVTIGVENTEVVVSKILDRFMNLWKIKDKEFYLIPGISVINFPKDTDFANQAFDLLTDGVRNSADNRGRIMRVEDILDEKERRINSLEKRQEILEKQYMETEDRMNRAVNADRSKSLFLAQMSHEIRTPMTAILGMTELLLRDSKDKKILGYANAIMNSGRNLLGIINDILDFSKIESGKLSIVNEKYMISSVVYDLVVGILQRVYEKKLALRIKFDPNIPMYLVGDEIRVKQLMFNILTNAIKYTQKGEVTFEIKGECIGSKYLLTVMISDTGIGIRKENLTRIFERFERFDPDINKSIEGTGLGLAIVRQLIELMGGNIHVESEYGVGSKFIITIPQEIGDETPSVYIKDVQRLSFACYFEGDELNSKDLDDTCSVLGILYNRYNDFDTFCAHAEDQNYTDIFVNTRVLNKLIATGNKLVYDQRLVCVCCYGDYIEEYRGKLLKAPLSTLNLGAFINGSSLLPQIKTLEEKNYVAPSAKILVVDDNAVNLKIFKSLCEPHGFDIDCAESGNACIDFTMKSEYDVIFLDHMMPQKDGIDTIREIFAMENNPNRNKPFVAFTANAVSGMKEMFLGVGFSDFLSKPIDPAKLESMLLQYIPENKIVFGAVKETEEKQEEKGEDLLLDSLNAIGMDTESALEYSGDSLSTLIGVLEIFVSDGREKLELMSKQIREGDYEGFTTQIHAVKSLTKGIGIRDLSEKALALEMAGKGGNFGFIDENAPETLKEYGETIDKVDRALTSAENNDPEVASQGSFLHDTSFDEMLITVKALLSQFEETAAQHIVRDLLRDETLSEEEKKLLHEIEKTLKLFDYDKVIKIITEALEN
ncbi:MAG: response regulator, partial [Lachnospiraceae bacterium]|nr:response regulator [Lachnospiraceae bacterium]